MRSRPRAALPPVGGGRRDGRARRAGRALATGADRARPFSARRFRRYRRARRWPTWSIAHYEDMLSFYGTELGVQVARKHLGWYLAGGGPVARARADPDGRGSRDGDRPSAGGLRRNGQVRGMNSYRSPYPVPGVIWASLPVPAFLIDLQGKFAEVNPAGENFLNASAKSLSGVPVFDRLHIDAPMDEALSRARSNQSPLFINDVDVTHRRAPAGAVQHPDRPDARQRRDRHAADFAARHRRSAWPVHAGQDVGPLGHRHGRDAGPRDQEPARRASPGRRSSCR